MTVRSSRTNEKMVPVLYVDIDDTIRKGYSELGKWVNTAADVEVFPQVPDILARYKAMGFRIAGISNQGGVALGHVKFTDVVSAMAETAKQCGGVFDKMVFCTHHPDAESQEMARCWCRKPHAGMIFEAAWTMSERYPDEIYPPHLALMVGDRPEDAQCAQAANIDFLDASLWRTGRHLENLEAQWAQARHRGS